MYTVQFETCQNGNISFPSQVSPHRALNGSVQSCNFIVHVTQTSKAYKNRMQLNAFPTYPFMDVAVHIRSTMQYPKQCRCIILLYGRTISIRPTNHQISIIHQIRVSLRQYSKLKRESSLCIIHHEKVDIFLRSNFPD
jgi:hypothetical protein